MANTWHIDTGGILKGNDEDYPAPHGKNIKLAVKIIIEETLGTDCHLDFYYLPDQLMVRENISKSKGISLDRITAIEYRINGAIRASRS